MSEIARCLKLQKQIVDTVELILQATIEYNKTIHSVTERKPIEVMSPASLELNLEIRNKIAKAQGEMLEVHNKNKQNTVFEVGEKVFVKNCKRLGNKLSPLYEEADVEQDLGTTIKDKVVHKNNLRKF